MRYKRKCTLIVIACFRHKRDCLINGGFGTLSVYSCQTRVLCNQSCDFTSEHVFVLGLLPMVLHLFQNSLTKIENIHAIQLSGDKYILLPGLVGNMGRYCTSV